MSNFYCDVKGTVQQTTDVALFGQEEGGVFYIFGRLNNNNKKTSTLYLTVHNKLLGGKGSESRAQALWKVQEDKVIRIFSMFL